MRVNAGGELAPDQVVGRERLIERTWAALEVQSVLMVAERRIGKTSVVKKMRSQERQGTRLLYRDVEGIGTPLEFAEIVARDLEPLLGGRSRVSTKLHGLFKQLAGVEIGGLLKFPPAMEPHWKALLSATIEDLVASTDGLRHVMVWDELPVMIAKIGKRAGEQSAMDVLDTLRALRQAHASLRMVYTGSIGLHHVLTVLRRSGHVNDSINDLRTIEVPELSAEDAAALAQALLAGEQLRCVDPEGTAKTIAEAVDHVPFYIHQVVGRTRDLGDEASPDLAHSIVRRALVDAQDGWRLAHYRDRVPEYYGADWAPVVWAVLDVVSDPKIPMPFRQLARLLRSTLPRERCRDAEVLAVIDGDDERLRLLLDHLARDHYLARDPDTGHFRFRFDLIRRWWRIQRGRA